MKVVWAGAFGNLGAEILRVLCGAGQWIFAVAAYISIVYIMFNGAQRMEKRQMKQYGHLKVCREYADKTPILLSLLPVYHLNRKEQTK